MWFSSLSVMPDRSSNARRQCLVRSTSLALAVLACANPMRLLAQTASPLPPELLPVLPFARLQGTGPVRFFGLLIYDLSLWAGKGFDLTQFDRHPFALTLIYAKPLNGKAIAERSLALMVQTGSIEPTVQKQWLTFMEQAFPNVAPKDRITGAYDGKGGVQFWHNGRATAARQELAFARLFFGIWLSPQTKAPALREALLSGKNG